MTRLFAILCVLLGTTAGGVAAPSRVFELWDGKPPGNFAVSGPENVQEPTPGEKGSILRITNVADPRLELYEPDAATRNGTGVIIVPGGGFGILASGHEGSDLAEWFRDRGVVAAVLQHRCPTNKLPKPWEFPVQDAQRAVSVLRSKSAELGLRADRIGLFGFSAGGQVALIAATNAGERLYPIGDAIDQTSCRPDFLMLCYPWRILADSSATALKREIRINRETPPTFIAQAGDDKASLAEGSVQAFLALRAEGVPAELHIYATGGHGFGLRPGGQPAPGDWPGRAELWLRAGGWVPPPTR